MIFIQLYVTIVRAHTLSLSIYQNVLNVSTVCACKKGHRCSVAVTTTTSVFSIVSSVCSCAVKKLYGYSSFATRTTCHNHTDKIDFWPLFCVRFFFLLVISLLLALTFEINSIDLLQM